MNNLPRGHIPVLDGLRGLAIALVMARHFTLGMEAHTAFDAGFLFVSSAGWIGVDLFFVLSGFLITGILLDARGQKGYFRNFYARRALRIFPLYYAVLLMLFVALPLLGRPADTIGQLQQAQFWYWTHLTNWWNASGGAMPLNTAHFWSLALEEQFYLVWPLVVLLAPGRRLYAACGIVIAGSFLLRLGMVIEGGVDAAYVITPARLDGLAMGGLLASVARDPGRLQWLRLWARPVTVAAFAVVTAIALVRGGLEWDRPVAAVGSLAIIAMFGGLITWCVTATDRSLVVRLFSARWLRGLGKYSYALYVFHYPLMSLAAYTPLDRLRSVLFAGSSMVGTGSYAIIMSALSLATAWLSWHLLESPFLRLKRHFEAPSAQRPSPAPPAGLKPASRAPLTVEA